MELKEMVALYRRWIWLLILALLMGLVGGYGASKMQKPVYASSAKVLIARSRQQSSADLLSLSDPQLVSTYVKLLKTQPFLAEVETRLGTRLDPDRIGVQILPDTQIIQIAVQDGDAARAAAIANTLVEVLVEQNEMLQAGRYSAYEEGLTEQVAKVQEQIDTLQAQISQINQANIEEQLKSANQEIQGLKDQISVLEKDIASYPSYLTETDLAVLADKKAQLDQLRSLLLLYRQIQTNLTFIGKPLASSEGRDDLRITSLQSTLDLYQRLYLALLNNLEAAKLARVQNTPTVTLIDPALISETPIGPKTVRNTVLSGMLGLLLAAGQVLLINYFDDTFRTAQKVEDVLHAPVIGQIMEAAQKRKWHGRASKADHRDAQLDNAFGDLRINLSRLMGDRAQKRILITSTARGEGKSTVSVHLAQAFLQAGKKVVLVDADLYHPQLHKRLGLQNEIGLTDILSGGIEWQTGAIKQGGLTILTSGAIPSSLSGLLESDEMGTLLDKIQKKADMVIVDGPPLFVVDAQALASKVGGVVLVAQQGETKIGVARSIAKKLELLDIHLYGVVLNRVPRSEGNYYEDYFEKGREEKSETQVREQEVGEKPQVHKDQVARVKRQAHPKKQKELEQPQAQVEKQEELGEPETAQV